MKKVPTILLVEDNDNDVRLVCRKLRRKSIQARPQVIRDGHEAIRYLQGEGLYKNRSTYPLPGVVILDLDLPGSSGLAILRWIRKQPTLAGLPVIVFTGSDCGRSAHEAMQNGADTYLLKGHDTDGLVHLLEQADLTWNARESKGKGNCQET
jgi:DNA-binding response OmpR family regulator